MILLGPRDAGETANLQWREEKQAKARSRKTVSGHFHFLLSRRVTPPARGFFKILTLECQIPRRLRQGRSKETLCHDGSRRTSSSECVEASRAVSRSARSVAEGFRTRGAASGHDVNTGATALRSEIGRPAAAPKCRTSTTSPSYCSSHGLSATPCRPTHYTSTGTSGTCSRSSTPGLVSHHRSSQAACSCPRPR